MNKHFYQYNTLIIDQYKYSISQPVEGVPPLVTAKSNTLS